MQRHAGRARLLRRGVALGTLDGWYADSFAWAGQPLAEAGLA